VSEGLLPKLLDLTHARANGELVCDAAGTEVHVCLYSGRIAWARDSKHPLEFTEHLKRIARLDDEMLEEVVADCAQSRAPIGETLVAWKLASPDQVRIALRHQTGTAFSVLQKCAYDVRTVFLARPTMSYRQDFTFDPQEFFSLLQKVPPATSGGADADPFLRPPVPERRGNGQGAPPGGGPAQPAARSAPVPVPPLSPPQRRKRLSPVAVVALVAVLLAGAVAALVAANRRSPPIDTGPRPTTEPFAAAQTPPPAPPPAAVATATQAAGTPTSARPGTVNGVTDAEVVLGMSGPFSGAARETGRAMRVGVETALALANEGGGVNGRRVRLVALDDGYDPTRTPRVIQELLDDRKVFAIVGSSGTATSAAALPLVMEHKALFVGALTGAPFLRKRPPERLVFNYRPSYAEETGAAVKYLVEVRRIPPQQIALFYQDDAFGSAGLAGVEQEIQRHRYSTAQMVRMTYKRNSADVKEALAVFGKERARIRAVVMVATYQAAIQFIQQVRDLGASPVFTNVSSVNSNALAEGLLSEGARYASDVVVTQTVPLPTAKATAAMEYQAALSRYFVGEKPDFVSFEGFILGRLLVEGIRRAGRDLSTEALVTALESIRDLDMGIGSTISLASTDHQGSHKVWGTLLQPDGSFKSIRLE
jgi:branched-chain amino acid transport system substrate-binding protein